MPLTPNPNPEPNPEPNPNPSQVHSFLVVHYAKADKVATSVGFYYMSNAIGRLMGTLGSGVIYTYAGSVMGPLAGSDARAGLAACFVAGTGSSLLAALITDTADIAMALRTPTQYAEEIKIRYACALAKLRATTAVSLAAQHSTLSSASFDSGARAR